MRPGPRPPFLEDQPYAPLLGAATDYTRRRGAQAVLRETWRMTNPSIQKEGYNHEEFSVSQLITNELFLFPFSFCLLFRRRLH